MNKKKPATREIIQYERIECANCGAQMDVHLVLNEKIAAASILGSITSERKAAAARNNGKKGGRPPSPNTHKRKAKATK